MRTLAKVYAGLFALLLPFVVIYLVGDGDNAGRVLFVLMLVAFAFLGVQALRIARHTPVPFPEDREDAAVADAAGEVGAFPSRSVWPLAVAGSATVLAFGLAFNGWIALPAVLGLLTACVGFALETRPSD